MDYLGSGILLGLSLSLLVGPIVITIIQASLDKGTWAGLAVGTGIWTSDLLFILVTYLGLEQINAWTAWSGFEKTMGIAGGLILIVFGLGIFLAKQKPIDLETRNYTAASFSGFWLKGFLVNTINPFTVFVWAGFAANLMAKIETSTDALFFYGGVLGTLVATDSAKAFFAGTLRKWLKPSVVHRIRQLSGITLFLFGIGILLVAFGVIDK